MALKSIFNTLKREGYIVKDLDQYLLSLNGEVNDRAINVNAPSQAGNCMRANYYARMGYEQDSNAIDPRTRRIFDNGTGVHERLQEYMKKQGMLVLDEVPLRCDVFNIQGHTDGLLKISKNELGILEIKSINTNSFSKLTGPKPEHKLQGHVYMYCAEERRKFLRATYPTQKEFEDSLEERLAYYKSLYPHLKDGNKYTREQKLAKKVEEHKRTDEILYSLSLPISKVIFLYEDKNTQDLKEFCVTREQEVIDGLLEYYQAINYHIENKILPEREGTSKSCSVCRWCQYKTSCFVV